MRILSACIGGADDVRRFVALASRIRRVRSQGAMSQ